MLANALVKFPGHSEPKDEDDHGANAKSLGIASALNVDLQEHDVVDYIRRQEGREKWILSKQSLPEKPDSDQRFGQ
jgi:hypothetical protein